MNRFVRTVAVVSAAVAAIAIFGCRAERSDDGSGSAAGRATEHPLVGDWQLRQTVHLYEAFEPDTAESADSTLFRFRADSSALLIEQTPQGLQTTVYRWFATDSTLMLESDTQVNTGTFPFRFNDSVFSYTVKFDTAVFGGLTGWEYIYTRLK